MGSTRLTVTMTDKILLAATLPVAGVAVLVGAVERALGGDGRASKFVARPFLWAYEGFSRSSREVKTQVLAFGYSGAGTSSDGSGDARVLSVTVGRDGRDKWYVDHLLLPPLGNGDYYLASCTVGSVQLLEAGIVVTDCLVGKPILLRGPGGVPVMVPPGTTIKINVTKLADSAKNFVGSVVLRSECPALEAARPPKIDPQARPSKPRSGEPERVVVRLTSNYPVAPGSLDNLRGQAPGQPCDSWVVTGILHENVAQLDSFRIAWVRSSSLTVFDSFTRFQDYVIRGGEFVTVTVKNVSGEPVKYDGKLVFERVNAPDKRSGSQTSHPAGELRVTSANGDSETSSETLKFMVISAREASESYNFYLRVPGEETDLWMVKSLHASPEVADHHELVSLKIGPPPHPEQVPVSFSWLEAMGGLRIGVACRGMTNVKLTVRQTTVSVLPFRAVLVLRSLGKGEAGSGSAT